jgi:hypothetical protein
MALAATWRMTRRRFWRGDRVVWTPLCGPPFLAKRALQLASEQASSLGHGAVEPGHVLVGVLDDTRACGPGAGAAAAPAHR